MPKMDISKISNELKTDQLNKIFHDIAVDMGTVYERLEYLTDLSEEQTVNNNIINLYRAQLYSLADTLSTNAQTYETNGLQLYHIDTNTATATYTDTVGTYGHVILDTSAEFNRFPTTTNFYGDNVPLYNSVSAFKDDVSVDQSDSLLYAVSDDPRRIYLEDLGASANVEYKFTSNVSTPRINSVIVSPVFGGMTNLDNLSYGFGDNWYRIGTGDYDSLYSREFVFKQKSNSTGIKFDAVPVPLGGSYYMGFYDIKAKYKIFKDEGSVRFDKTIPVPTYNDIRKIELEYDYFGTISHIPNIFSKLFKIEIYDNNLSTKIYDSTSDQYPHTKEQTPINIPVGNLIIIITIYRYDDISPIFKYLSLGVD